MSAPLLKIKQGNSTALQTVIPSGAIVTMKSSGKLKDPERVLLDIEDDSGGKWVDWGPSNDWPSKARAKLEKSTTALPLIVKALSLMYGDGVVYWLDEKVDGKLVKNFVDIPEVDDFFYENDIDQFMIEQLMDFKFYGNQFQEFILNPLKTKVIHLYHKEAEFTRKSAQNEKSKKFEKIGYTGNWAEDDKPAEIKLLDKTVNGKEYLMEQVAKSGGKFANHTMFPSPGRKVYGFPPHGALYLDKGWLDYSNNIPAIMNSMIDNMIAIKYHIEIPYEYWGSVYPEWAQWDEKKQKVKIDEKLTEMDEWLTGADNAYSTFISHFATDPITRKAIPGWKITAIDDKVKKDEWIPGTQEADQQIARALSIDPSMAGIQAQGGKLGAGSGSDKRTGFANSVSLSKMETKIVFECLELVKKINGWPRNLKFGFAHKLPTTLDKNPTGQQTEA